MGLLGEVESAIDNLPKWAAPQHVKKNLMTISDDVFINFEPLGVVLVIGAWNYPLVVCLQPVVGAIAAGTDMLHVYLFFLFFFPLHTYIKSTTTPTRQ